MQLRINGFSIRCTINVESLRTLDLTFALDREMIADPRKNARALFQLFPRDDEVTPEKSWFILQQQFEFDFPEFRRVFDTEQWHHFAPFNNSKAFQFAKMNRLNFLTVDTN